MIVTKPRILSAFFGEMRGNCGFIAAEIGRATREMVHCCERIVTALLHLHLVVDAVHRRHERDGHEPDDDAHEDDHSRLEEAREALDL